VNCVFATATIQTGHLTLEGCFFDGAYDFNINMYGIYGAESVVATGCNITEFRGNVLFSGGKVAISNCTFPDNVGEGATVIAGIDDVTITDSTFGKRTFGTRMPGANGTTTVVRSESGDITIENSSFAGYATQYLLYSSKGNISVTNTTITSNMITNSGEKGGHLIHSRGNTTIDSSVVSFNDGVASFNDGVLIYSTGIISIINSTLAQNSGTLLQSGTAAVIANSSVTWNSASMELCSPSIVRDSMFAANYGYGVFRSCSFPALEAIAHEVIFSLSVRHCKFESNNFLVSLSQQTGTTELLFITLMHLVFIILLALTVVEIADSEIRGGVGCVNASVPLSLQLRNISCSNTTYGIRIQQGNVSIDNCTFAYNSGGCCTIAEVGEMVVNNSIFTNNIGSSLFNGGNTVITHSSFVQNSAVVFQACDNTVVRHSTFTSNRDIFSSCLSFEPELHLRDHARDVASTKVSARNCVFQANHAILNFSRPAAGQRFFSISLHSFANSSV